MEPFARGKRGTKAQVAAEVTEVEDALTKRLVFRKAKAPKQPRRTRRPHDRQPPLADSKAVQVQLLSRFS